MEYIRIKGLRENNLKNLSFSVPKNKIVVFTGVSGSGKSSVVFDTIAAESGRQMNETYPAFVRSRLPKYKQPKADFISGLTPAVIVDQSRLGGNSRSTVGTISDMYSMLRLLFSRVGYPHVGSSSYFSFNNPNGMCLECGGIGKKTVLDLDAIIDKEKSFEEGGIENTLFQPGAWFYTQYMNAGIFDTHKPIKDFTEEEYNLLMYGSETKDGPRKNKRIEGIHNHMSRLMLNRDLSNHSEIQQQRASQLIKTSECGCCHGARLNAAALSCKILGFNIYEMCQMEFTELYEVLGKLKDDRVQELVDNLRRGLLRMIEIGLPYLNLNRETSTLSGGEAQRVKLVRYMGSSLTGMTYIFDEPSTGLHPRDVGRMNNMLKSLRDKGNTVLVVEHDKDVISIADYVIDMGPLAGSKGGTIVFEGSYDELLEADTLTGHAMKEKLSIKEKVRIPKEYISIKGARVNNLKDIDVDIPLNVMTVVTGVAGSGKSSLISDVFAKENADRVIEVDQSPVTATNRSLPASYLGFFDDIRKLMAAENKMDAGLFSYNSKGACPVCKGKGVIVTELAFMDPIVTECEACNGKRYSDEALSYTYKGKTILDILDMTAEQALEFFETPKIIKSIKAMCEAGVGYLTLGQPLSTLSGGELQRMKLAKNMNKKGNIYVLDEPTTGLHPKDISKLMKVFDHLVDRGNTVVIIEHNLDVMRHADYIIDIGPDGGKNGGQVVFTGTPADMIKNPTTITATYLAGK